MIIPGKKYGNPWQQVAEHDQRMGRIAAGGELPHGLTPTQMMEMNNRLDSFLPSLASARESSRLELPDGMSRSAQAFPMQSSATPSGVGIFSAGGGGNTFSTPQQPYQPEFASPDRQQYPVHRILANRYWRLFHKLDPVAGNVIDLYAEMLASDAEITGDGVQGEVKEVFERMLEETKVFALFPHFVREFMILGEAVPHCFFDDDKGYWTYIAMHNPDQLEVIHAPFINMEPIIEYIPDDKLRAILTSSDPSLAKVRAQMPPELVARLQSRQNIPLDPLNMTFIPRKLHPYDTRGTSIYSRLWRVFMYEDAVFSASIATARRHAGPLKIAKLGNPATGWIPGPEHERRLIELLARAETDPHAFLVYHYGVAFEAFGTTDRMMSIAREWDVIERMKLVALGVSKAFVHGEVTYASATTGLQVFLQRLLALRTMFEVQWWYPKFFKPISEINGFIKPTQAELNHRVRTRRTASDVDEDDRWIVPQLMWDRKLDPHIDSALLQAIQQLEGLGVKISKGTKAGAAGFNYESEAEKVVQEIEFEQNIGLLPPPGMVPMGGVPGMEGGQPQMVQEGTDRQPLELTDALKTGPDVDQDIIDLKLLISSGETDSERWLPLSSSVDFVHLLDRGDGQGIWEYLDDYLIQMEDVSDEEIEMIRKELVLSGLIPPANIDHLEALEKRLPNDAGMLSNEDFDAVLSGKVIPFKNKKDDTFLTGMPAYRTVSRSFNHESGYSISGNLRKKKAQLPTPHMDDPENYTSRAEWQKVLDRLPLPTDAKRYIKQLENTFTDGWEDSFDNVWGSFEQMLDRGMPITNEFVVDILSQGLKGLRKNVTRQDVKNSLMGVYHNGKLFAYEPTNFKEKKEERLAKRGRRVTKLGVTIDTFDDRIILDTIVDSALGRVTSVTDRDVRQNVLERLSDPAHLESNPVGMANAVIRQERERIEEGLARADDQARMELRNQIQDLYENQLWKIERIMRTESLGAYWVSALRGYQEQGIKKIKFNAHKDEKTCSLCRGYNNTDFDIAELLAMPHPLLAALTHPNCRCWPTPVITGFTFEEFERQYMQTHNQFPESYHGIDTNVLSVEDVLEDVSTKTTEFKSTPVEAAEGLQELVDTAIVNSPYKSDFPDNVQFVADVAEHPEFVRTVAPTENLQNQVMSWTSPSGVTYVSMFGLDQGDASSTMTRTWAQDIWDKNPTVQNTFSTLYADTTARTTPSNIDPTAARAMAETYGRFMVGRKVWVGTVEGVNLNKNFRDASDAEARNQLSRLGISLADSDAIVEWRKYNPIWDLDTGQFIETDVPTTLNRFVNAQASDDPQAMFVESMVTYVQDPIRLTTRDPELYEKLKNEFFGRKEFIDKPAV